MIRILGTIFAGLLGLAFGSFLNVCLSRWPQGESIVQPRSHCRNCSHILPWWENVPLFSWLALRGRCRICCTWIGWRYPLVELAGGALWALYAYRFLSEHWHTDATTTDFSLGLVSLCGKLIFCWLLLALAVLDAENLWLPDWITLPGTALGFTIRIVTIVSIAVGPGADAFENVRYGTLGVVFERLFAILAAAALILLIRWVYWLIRRREGIGLGDAKLMALLAAWLGLPGALLAFGLGVVLGAAVALALLAASARSTNESAWALKRLPLGTFLCIGGIVSGLWGEQIIAAYLRWSGL